MSSSKTADQANYLTLTINTKPLSEHGVRISSRTANREVHGESRRRVRISGHEQGVRISSRKRGQLLSTAA